MAAPEAQGDGVEEHLEPPPPQLNQVQDEIQLGGQDRRIPIVETLESEPELPPNWNTGAMPPRPGGVADNLPPLPPSLGSVSGRASTQSGYTPAGGGQLGAGSGRAGSYRGVRVIGDRSHLSQSRTVSEASRSCATIIGNETVPGALLRHVEVL